MLVLHCVDYCLIVDYAGPGIDNGLGIDAVSCREPWREIKVLRRVVAGSMISFSPERIGDQRGREIADLACGALRYTIAEVGIEIQVLIDSIPFLS